MKISAVISSDIIKKDRIDKDKKQLLNFTVIAAALITGVVLYILTEDNVSCGILDIFTKFSVNFTSKTKFEIFSGMLLAHLPYIALVIILGTSSFGSPLIIILSFIKAMGLGMLGAYIYSAFGLQGIEYGMLVFFPGKFVLIFSMLYIMHFSANNSEYINKLTKGECKTENNRGLYAVKSSTAALLFVLSSLIDCFLAVSFSQLFSF